MSAEPVHEEREVQLVVDDSFEPPSLRALAEEVEDRGTESLHAVYWDTDDLALARAGVGLRHRNGTWTYKGRTRHEGHAVVREEREVRAPAGELPAVLTDAVSRWTDPGRLRAHVEVITHRQTTLARRGAETAEVVHDRVTVRAGETVVDRFTVMEVEYAPPSDALAGEIVGALIAHGARLSDAPKYVRALRALGHHVEDVREP